MGKKKPPSAAELFLATAAIYYGTNNGRKQSNGKSRFRADCYDLCPREAAEIPPPTSHWECAGVIGGEISL